MRNESAHTTDGVKRPRILIYCQHVLGMGHLIRTMAIARALRNCAVVFVNGGESISGLDIPSGVTIVNLPPLTSDSEFRSLNVHSEGSTLEQVQLARKKILFDLLDHFCPDVVIIELFPFGRKQFAFELLPLLAHIRLSAPSTKVVCSLRDILVTKQDQTRHEDWVVSVMNRYFDLLLIHSDPTFQTLDETFSRCRDLRCDVRYTGFVAQHSDVSTDLPAAEGTSTSDDCPLILASVGGGRVGYELLDSSIRASALLIRRLPHRMLLFTGPYMPDHQYDLLRELALHYLHIDVRRFTSSFQSLMQQATLSISMAGYNTCMNLLTTGTRALVWPFTGHKNDEQTIRAQKLERLGLLTLLGPADLEPDQLAGQILTSLSRSQIPTPHSINTNGGRETAFAIERLAAQPYSRTLDASTASTSALVHQPSQWLTELKHVLDAKEAEGRKLHIFLRDDDVDEDEDSLKHLLDLALARNVPMNLEIIPGRLTPACTTLLKNVLRADRALLSLDQHGWMHSNHEAEGRKCEFGPSRSFAQQLNDIARGKAILEATFDELFFPAFTPPWNRCTKDTYRVLDELGFQVLSKDCGKERVTEHRFSDISTTLDLYTWKTEASMKSPDEIIRRLIGQLEELPIVGLLLHHKVMNDEAFLFLDQLLCELTRYPVVQFHTFRALLPLSVESRMVSR